MKYVLVVVAVAVDGADRAVNQSRARYMKRVGGIRSSNGCGHGRIAIERDRSCERGLTRPSKKRWTEVTQENGGSLRRKSQAVEGTHDGQFRAHI